MITYLTHNGYVKFWIQTTGFATLSQCNQLCAYYLCQCHFVLLSATSLTGGQEVR